MASTDWFARSVALASLVIAVLALGWAVTSWRLSGSAVRVHALLYRQRLVVHVFNAGRTADTIEEAVLGGLRQGRYGGPLSRELGLPLRLEPGEAKHWDLDARSLPAARLASAAGGWDSLWLLMGSMRQRRAEVVPVAQDLPDRVGWRLVPRRVKATRYLPLIAAGGGLAVASAPPMAPLILTVLGIWVFVRGYLALVTRRGSGRRRFERWVFAAGFGVAVVQALTADAQVPPERVPSWAAWLLVVYIATAVLLAVPGLVPVAADAVRDVRASTARALAGLASWRPRAVRSRRVVGASGSSPTKGSRDSHA